MHSIPAGTAFAVGGGCGQRGQIPAWFGPADHCPLPDNTAAATTHKKQGIVPGKRGSKYRTTCPHCADGGSVSLQAGSSIRTRARQPPFVCCHGFHGVNGLAGAALTIDCLREDGMMIAHVKCLNSHLVMRILGAAAASSHCNPGHIRVGQARERLGTTKGGDDCISNDSLRRRRVLEEIN